MSLGRSGRLLELHLGDGRDREIANGLAYAFGVTSAGGNIWVCESWAHRVVAYGNGKKATPVVSRLPCYPSRLTPAASGGYWLTAFTCRSQLVEFVLRQRAYRTRMMSEIDPSILNRPSSQFRQHLPGTAARGASEDASAKQTLAPPRSYGLPVNAPLGGRTNPIFVA